MKISDSYQNHQLQERIKVERSYLNKLKKIGGEKNPNLEVDHSSPNLELKTLTLLEKNPSKNGVLVVKEKKDLWGLEKLKRRRRSRRRIEAEDGGGCDAVDGGLRNYNEEDWGGDG
ncbi:hypothetical protein ACH5RR_029643 [Cinchona calisaya]|uniref:Uncharacterized protein n=1 Tax=Cinchona calisaya TaxID=153742 RepID=A0ABD2YWN1_9GENT